MTRLLNYVLGILLYFLAACAVTENIAIEKKENQRRAQEYSAQKAGDALLVWTDGELTLEDYQNGYNPESAHPLTEVSTLLSGLVALAASQDGLLTLEEPVSETITEWKDDPQKSKITISDLLHLTSGLDGRDYKSVPSYQDAISTPLIHEPSDGFEYGPTAFQVFGALMERKTEGGYLKSRILEPLGIPGGRWLVVPNTTSEEISTMSDLAPRFFDGAHLKAKELLRIGILLVQDGTFEGKEVISNLNKITEPTTASPGYGLTVWLNADIESYWKAEKDTSFFNEIPADIMFIREEKKLISDTAPSDLYMAAGRFNQRLYILPSKETVIVRLGREDYTWDDSEFLDLLLNEKNLF